MRPMIAASGILRISEGDDSIKITGSSEEKQLISSCVIF